MSYISLTNDFVNFVKNLQGVLGIKVKIMLDWDPKGKQGPTTPLPDLVTIHPPKEEDEYSTRPGTASAFVAPPTDIPVAAA